MGGSVGSVGSVGASVEAWVSAVPVSPEAPVSPVTSVGFGSGRTAVSAGFWVWPCSGRFSMSFRGLLMKVMVSSPPLMP